MAPSSSAAPSLAHACPSPSPACAKSLISKIPNLAGHSREINRELVLFFPRAVLKHFRAPERKVMSTTSTPIASPQETIAARLRNFALGALFALVLLVPKLLNIRRDPRSWLAFPVLPALPHPSLVNP